MGWGGGNRRKKEKKLTLPMSAVFLCMVAEIFSILHKFYMLKFHFFFLFLQLIPGTMLA